MSLLEDFFFSNREIALQYIQSYSGTWYTWGGDDPGGFDCSGLAIEYLKSIGFLQGNQDFTASELYTLLKGSNRPRRGFLVFYSNSKDEIIHVEIMLNRSLSIGASGGGSQVKTIEDAIKHNAFIKVRNHDRGQKIKGFGDPFI